MFLTQYRGEEVRSLKWYELLSETLSIYLYTRIVTLNRRENE